MLTQKERILTYLQENKGEWVNVRKFIQEMYISQSHARIFELQREGHKIEHSDFTDQFGFKSVKLIPQQKKLL